MGMLKCLIGAAIGAGIGAALWIAIGYFTGFEVGYVAWGVGFLAGFGVQYVGTKELGPMPGVIAAACAVVAILIAKFAVAGLLVAKVLDPIDIDQPDTDTVIADIARDVAVDFEADGRELDWPEPADTPRESFPEEVWAEAQQRWNALSAQQQQARSDEVRALRNELVEQQRAKLREEVFLGSFAMWDLLWFGLATLTAFKMGSGLTSEESIPEEPTPEK